MQAGNDDPISYATAASALMHLLHNSENADAVDGRSCIDIKRLLREGGLQVRAETVGPLLADPVGSVGFASTLEKIKARAKHAAGP